MSEQFFYVYLKFIPKIVTLAEPMLRQREVIVEVSKRLVLLRQADPALVKENLTEKSIALELARRAALGTFPTVAQRILGLYDQNEPTWYEDQPPIINERPCDYEDNGTRAWRVV
jgi:hypothetical protein